MKTNKTEDPIVRQWRLKVLRRRLTELQLQMSELLAEIEDLGSVEHDENPEFPACMDAQGREHGEY